jgi:Ca2+-binding RTX toxin-like protein
MNLNHLHLKGSLIGFHTPSLLSNNTASALRPANAAAVNLTGTAGNDTLRGGAGQDTLKGLGGNDILYGGGEYDQLFGGAGNDTLRGETGEDLLEGGTGNDLLDGGTHGADIFGDAAAYETASAGVTVNLSLTGAQNTGGAGMDTLINIESLIGSNFADTLIGNSGTNILLGMAGNDTLRGGDGMDLLWDYEGNNILDGGAGRDGIIFWGANRGVTVNLALTGSQNTGVGMSTLKSIEALLGSSYADTLIGNASNNELEGDSGRDVLNGAGGNDKLTGDSGADTFRFNSTLNASTNIDTIIGFSISSGDVIQLENAIFKKLTVTGVLNAANFRANTSGTAFDSNDYVVYETDTGKLFYDADGNGASAKVQFALVGTSTHAVLAAADFSVI